jgi:hypothetical protein
LDGTQRPIITGIVDEQRADLNGIVKMRRAIATELRKALSNGTVDADTVTSLDREYGGLDGEISYFYATAFAEVGKTLTSAQEETLMGIRDLADYPCPAGKMYLYSELIDQPEIQNTDFLFK